ncbi:unnamed protein product [Angiostrongylus costaricensis]|uniref:Uncharacterized protein n=1 Tax=Angiostrongylus costaricensis TaxID=334426 RepID=A0A0R3PEG7_ANGCS|nr:unnamed protein product [Angiostrongylus costaricensis]
MFMRNGLVSYGPLMFTGVNMPIYLGREINMINGLALELSRTKRVAWGVFENIEDVVKRTKNTILRAHLFTTRFFLHIRQEHGRYLNRMNDVTCEGRDSKLRPMSTDQKSNMPFYTPGWRR